MALDLKENHSVFQVDQLVKYFEDSKGKVCDLHDPIGNTLCNMSTSTVFGQTYGWDDPKMLEVNLYVLRAKHKHTTT